jgi:uncharacterized protein YggE
VQAARDEKKKILEAEQAAIEAAEARAQEMAEAGKGTVAAVETEAEKAIQRAEREYHELEAQFKEQLGLGTTEAGG